jgi:acyl carrier protein
VASPISQIKAIIEQVAKKDMAFIDEKSVIADLPIDSLDFFTVIGDLEDSTGRTMEDSKMEALHTIGDLTSHFFDT